MHKKKILILHIGYPKTGTTTIQNSNLLELVDGMTAFSDHSSKKILIKEFSKIFSRRPSSVWKQAPTAELVQDLWAFVRSSAGVFFYSHEIMLRPFFFQDFERKHFELVATSEFPILNHLRAPVDIKPEDIDIKALVTLRNQAEFLASLYAQQSRLIKFASQQDFENRVNTVLQTSSTKGHRFLEYDRLWSGLADILGPESVEFLFLEEMNTDLFWKNLACILNLSDAVLEENHSPKNARNFRRSTGKAWHLREDERLKKRLGRVGVVLHWIERMRAALSIPSPEADRGCIAIKPQMETAIKQQFKSSNCRLAAFLGRELPPDFF